MSIATAAPLAAGRPPRQAGTMVSLVAIPAALAVSGLVVAQSSYSSYSTITADPVSNWASGSVILTDDDANAAAFTATNLKPGSTGTRCIVVTSRGSLPSDVRLYGRNGTGSTSLASSMNLTVVQGTGGSFGSCDGFTPLSSGAVVYDGSFVGFGTSHTSYANGAGGWSPSGAAPESRTYRITYRVSPDAPDDTQNASIGGDIVFETQNS